MHSESLPMVTSVIEGQSEGRVGIGKPPMESGMRTFWGQPMYKRRKVSAIRDYPPGCGRFRARVRIMPKVDTAKGSVLKEKSVEAEPQHSEFLSSFPTETSDRNFMGPKFLSPDVSLAGSSGYLQKAVTGRCPSLRRVSAIRDFPPLCGRNFLSQSKGECLKGISSLENKRMGQRDLEVEKKPLKKIAVTDVKEVEKIVRDGDACNGKLIDVQLTGGTEERRRKRVDCFAWRDGCKAGIRTKDSLNHSRKKLLKNKKGNAASEGMGKLVVLEKDGIDTNDSIKFSNVYRSCGFNVNVPPLGHRNLSGRNSDSDVTRNTVRETLRLFQAVYRKLLQEEEAKLKDRANTHRRIDLQAAKILKNKGKYVNVGKQILGSVPGVEVGDEFDYRVELNIVGLHRHLQGGIDYVKHNGEILATSIVASGGYTDELDNSDVLIYSGQGGNVMNINKEPEDQKLERGNLALKNSGKKKNPVRVIRGTLSEDRRYKRYVYDGLYVVETYWQDMGPHGKLIFRFRLRRIPDQPELPWIEVKKSKKFVIRKGLCVDDISHGKEPFPICAVNTIDNEKPPSFEYITRMIYPDWCHPIPAEGCNCTNRCSDPAICSCAVKNGGGIPFNHTGSIVEAKPLVYECGPSCNCPSTCYNRVSQHGIKFPLEIYKTHKMGWGVRSLSSIPSGSFICEYLGELLEDNEAEQRTGNDEYLFDIGNNFINNCILSDGVSRHEVLEDGGGFTIDAAWYGNVGRFVNHSCSPNLYAQNVLYDHGDHRIPHIMLFAAENIPPLKELTYDYNYMKDQILDSDGNIKKKDCYCGSVGCTGRMY